jgi:hypothetical protein
MYKKEMRHQLKEADKYYAIEITTGKNYSPGVVKEIWSKRSFHMRYYFRLSRILDKKEKDLYRKYNFLYNLLYFLFG